MSRIVSARTRDPLSGNGVQSIAHKIAVARLLRPRRERPCHRTAEQCEEIAPLHVEHEALPRRICKVHVSQRPADGLRTAQNYSNSEARFYLERGPPGM